MKPADQASQPGGGSPCLKAALDYAARGWPVLPLHLSTAGVCSCQKGAECPRKGKHPRTRHGLHDATTDPSLIRRWWATWPDANVAIATGARAGVWVLDVDRDAGKGIDGGATLAALEAANGALPFTRSARTGRGGVHYLFEHPGREARIDNDSARKLGAGLDVRGDGGYIVAPPSLHASGTRYAWEDDYPEAPAPPWLLDLVVHVPAAASVPIPANAAAPAGDRVGRYKEAAIADEARQLAATSEGRNTRLNTAALKLGRLAAAAGIAEAEAEAALREACRANGLLADDGEAQFRKTFRSGWARGLREPKPIPPRNGMPGGEVEVKVEGAAQGGGQAGSARGAAEGDRKRQAAPKQAPSRPDTRPDITLTNKRDDHAIARDIIGALQGLNEAGPPHIFKQGRGVVRLVVDQNGDQAADKVIVAEQLRPPALKAHIDERMRAWAEVVKDGETKREPFPIRKDHAEQILAQSDWPFPVLRAVLHSPVFSPTGALAAREGFNHEAAVYLDLGGFDVPEVPERPTPGDLAYAKSLVLGELLADFPFKDAASKAHAVALGLLPFVRPMINGPTPLHLVSAPVYGSGKTKLAKVLSLISTGRHPQSITAARDDDEWRKRITASLEKSPTYTVIDNLTKLDSEHLAAVLTGEFWEDRVLGSSRNVRLPNLTAWVATGNNPTMGTEMARRVAWIRLDPDTERPWERGDFLHDPLEDWVQENRAELTWAFLVFVRTWLAAGRPTGRESIGSFESWARVVGGILETAGIPGFLSNRNDLFDEADIDTTEWGLFVEEWYRRHAGLDVRTAQLIAIAHEHAILGHILRDGPEQVQKQRLGKALRARVDRVIAGYKLILGGGDGHLKVGTFRLARAGSAQPEAGSLRESTEPLPQLTITL